MKDAASPSSVLSNLVPGTEYTVAINTVKDGTCGPLKICIFTTCPPDLGSNITITSISTTSATAVFEPPSSGCFDGYSLTLDPSEYGETATDIPKDAASPSSVLCNLIRDTKYVVTVNAVSGRKDGAQKSATFRTLSLNTEDDESSCYNINSDPRGLCIIINNMKFGGDGSRDRLGSDVDEKKLCDIFTKLKFQIQAHNDLEADRIIGVVKRVADTDHSKYDCLVFCILSHGKEEHISGVDGQLVKISDITFHFKGVNCPTLRAKPKLFFIQACQGSTAQPGFEVQADSVKASLTLPNEADILIGYSTVPGFFSYRNTAEGSWYIGALVKMLERYCDREDLLSIMTMVNNEVSNKGHLTMKQCPTPYTTLRKKVFLRSY